MLGGRFKYKLEILKIMRNEINPFSENARRKEVVIGLLSRMEADIVALDGSLPVISIEGVGRLMSGGSIFLSVPNSEQCWLETDSNNVRYDPSESFGNRSNIMYSEKINGVRKHAMKEKSYRFIIKLAGQRPRQ